MFGCTALGLLLNQKSSVKQLFESQVLRVVAPLILDDKQTVRNAAAAFLRLISDIYLTILICQTRSNRFSPPPVLCRLSIVTSDFSCKHTIIIWIIEFGSNKIVQSNQISIILAYCVGFYCVCLHDAFRWLSEEGGFDACEKMVQQDVLTPISRCLLNVSPECSAHLISLYSLH